MPNPAIRIVLPAFLLILAGCEGGVTDQTKTLYPPAAMLTPYERVVDYTPAPDQPGSRVPLDACLGMWERVYHLGADSIRYYDVGAAFDQGLYPVKIDSVSFDQETLSWYSNDYSYTGYERSEPLRYDWAVYGYSGSVFRQTMPTARAIILASPAPLSSFSKSKGVNLQYYGEENGQLVIRYLHAADSLDPNGAYVEGQPFRVADNGRVSLSPQLLHDVPVNSWVWIDLQHEAFSTVRDTIGHTIGLYSLRGDVYSFYVTE